MDDLNQKIENLLNSPEGQAKLQSMLAALGGAPPEDTKAPDTSGTDMLSGLAQALSGKSDGTVDFAEQLAKLLPLIQTGAAPPPPVAPVTGGMVPFGMGDLGGLGGLAGLLGALGGTGPAANSAGSKGGGEAPTLDLARMFKLLQMASGANGRDDPYILLLRALRPFLQETQQKKLDDLLPLIGLFQLFPPLQGKGEETPTPTLTPED